MKPKHIALLVITIAVIMTITLSCILVTTNRGIESIDVSDRDGAPFFRPYAEYTKGNK